MPVIGVFNASKAGGWEGRICTLFISRRVKFVPNDNRHSSSSPDFHLISLGCQIGVAWNRRTSREDGRQYLSVQLEDPSLPAPITAALFLNDSELTANLVWTSKLKGGE